MLFIEVISSLDSLKIPIFTFTFFPLQNLPKNMNQLLALPCIPSINSPLFCRKGGNHLIQDIILSLLFQLMEKDTNKTVLIFTINGINSLLGWNAVLAALDYFAGAFPDYNIYSFLPIPVFIGYILVGSTYHILSNKYKYIQLITVGNIGINIALAAILIVSIVLKETAVGFMLLLLSALMIGVSANLSQLSFFAMINYLSQNVVSKFTVGTAISGLFITLIRIVILVIAGSNSTSIIPIIIYFAIALVFNTLDLFMNIQFCKSQVYKNKIDKFLVHVEATDDSLKSSMISQSAEAKSAEEALAIEQKRIQGQNYFKTLLQTSKHVFPYHLIIMFTFVITFTLFPGPSLDKKIDGLDTSWSVILILLMYNIGDTVGKYSAEINNIFNRYSLFFLFFSRLIFFLPITFMGTNSDSKNDDYLINNYFFPFFNQLLFGITNGFCINASFIMAFKICPVAFKKYAGVFCGLILQVGIIIGTIVEVPFAIAFDL